MFEYEKIVAMECVIAASANFFDELHTDQCIWTELEKFIIAQTSWSKNFLRLLIHVENAYHITLNLLDEYAELWEEKLIEIVINAECKPKITSKIQGELYQKSACDHHRSMAYDYFNTQSNYQNREISPA